ELRVQRVVSVDLPRVRVEATERREEDLPTHTQLRLYLDDLRHLFELRPQSRRGESGFQRSSILQGVCERRSVAQAVGKDVIRSLDQGDAAGHGQETCNCGVTRLRRARTVEAGKRERCARIYRQRLRRGAHAQLRVASYRHK